MIFSLEISQHEYEINYVAGYRSRDGQIFWLFLIVPTKRTKLY
eukprot:UN19881